MAAIPFGMNEGVCLSDASKLVDTYRWSEAQVVRGYIGLGIGCLIFLGITYAAKLGRARAEVRHPSPGPLPAD